jgi:hypothetical protein
MKKTLQEQYSLIKEGKGHRDVFMKQAKATFPNQFRNAATFDEIVNGLKHKNVIVENVVGTEPINQLPSTKKESYEIAFEKFLKESQEESEKAELKTTSKQVEEDLSKGFDTSDKSNPDNLIFDQVMKGYYTEMCEPKNKDKTMEQIKAIVFKNLEKNPIYYTEKGQFGIKDLGYTTEHPGLGTPKEPKGKYKSSGYGDLNENIGKNYPDSIEGEYNGSPQKFDGVDLHSFLIDMLDISNSEDDFVRKVIMGITNDSDSISSQDEQKLRRWYAKNSPSVTEDHKPGDKVIYKGTKYTVVDETDTIITLKDESGNIITKNYNQFKQGEYKGDVNESNLRKVVREIIDTELDEMRGGGNYGILNINPTGKGEGGKRFIPNQLPLPLEIRKRFGDHMVYNPSNNTFFISQILYNNLIKGYADQPALKKLIMDIPQMVKQVLNKTQNYGNPTQLPKQFKTYMPFIAPVEKAKANAFNKDRTKQYYSAGDFLFPNLNKEKYGAQDINEGDVDYYTSVIASNTMDEETAYAWLEDQGVDSSTIDTIMAQSFPTNESLNENILRKIIRESVEKELAAINKEAESEVISTKLEKIEAAIEKRQSQLNKLDEDEDMKALTDKTKIKQAQKDIKTLEKAKAKLEKQLSKVQKKNKDITPTEVIDEDEPIGEAIDDQKVDKVKTSLEDINKTVDDISTKAKDMFEVEGELPQKLINQIVKMHVEDGMEIEDVASNFPEMYDEVIEFLDGYDTGLDYDI